MLTGAEQSQQLTEEDKTGVAYNKTEGKKKLIPQKDRLERAQKEAEKQVNELKKHRAKNSVEGGDSGGMVPIYFIYRGKPPPYGACRVCFL